MTRVPLVIEPDEEHPDCAMILVDAVVAGLARRFVLDTGAARTGVIRDEYTGTLPSHGRDRWAGVFASRSDELVTLPWLTLGPVTVTDLEVHRVPVGPNLLGMDVLASVALRLDPARSELLLVGSGSVPTRWPLRRTPRGHALLDVRLGEVAAAALFDSGAGVTVADRGFIDRHPDLFQPAGSATSTDAGGTRLETDLYLMAESRIGDMRFAASKVAAVALPQDGWRMDLVLGFPLLRQAVWTLDLPANRWNVTTSQPT